MTSTYAWLVIFMLGLIWLFMACNVMLFDIFDWTMLNVNYFLAIELYYGLIL